MAAANAKLDDQIQLSPETYNIENVSESDERVIEMVSSMQTLILSSLLLLLCTNMIKVSWNPRTARTLRCS